MRRIKFSIIAVLLLYCYQLKAQETITLSLDSAVNYAIHHNKTLINSKYAIDKSTEKIKEAISQGLPQINTSLDYTNFLGAEVSLQLNPSAPPAVIEFNPTSNFTATASQLVFNGNYYVGIQLSKLAKNLTEQSYQKDELNVKEQTTQAYYMVLASERILNTLKENKANAQMMYEKTRNLANAGIIEETDAKKLSIMVTSIDNALKSTERQVELGYNLLRLQLGLETDQIIKLSSNLDEIARQNIVHSISTEPFNIQNNHDFKLVTIQGEITKKGIDMARASYLPTLATFYSYTEKIKKPAFDISPKHVLGLTLNIPVFSGGQRRSQLNQAKIDFNINQNTKEQLAEQLTLQERQLEYNYKNLFEQYLTQKENIEIAKEVLDKMNLKYGQGVVSSLELTSANSDYLTAESNYINIMLQLLNAELALRKINSKL